MLRKLAAILSADVKGFSRLMGEDKEAWSEMLIDLPLLKSKGP
jgi:hypothetical protein